MRALRPLASLVVLALAGSPAGAQTVRSGSDNARAMQQIQQLTAERAALTAENERLKQQLEEARRESSAGEEAERQALARRAQAAEATAGRLLAARSAESEETTRLRGQLEELVSKFRETAQTLKGVEAQRNELGGRLASAEQGLETCRANNAELLQINDEVLVRLEQTGFWTKLAADEPFTRLKRTQLENLAAGYRVRAGELAVPPPTGRSVESP